MRSQLLCVLLAAATAVACDNKGRFGSILDDAGLPDAPPGVAIDSAPGTPDAPVVNPDDPDAAPRPDAMPRPDAGPMPDAFARVDASPPPDAAPGSPDARPQQCGNGMVEFPEECDDAGSSPTCAADCTFKPTAYRITSLALIDPHITLLLFGLTCFDGTSFGNDQLQMALDGDSDGDGNLDFGALIVFRPLDEVPGHMPIADFVNATCTAPAETTMCSGGADMSFPIPTVNSGAGATCLAALPGTSNAMYTPGPNRATGPCFTSPSFSFAFPAMGVDISLSDAQLAATYDDANNGLKSGLIRGFLSEDDANEILLDLSQIPGHMAGEPPTPFSELLPGGDNNCSLYSDKDVGTNGQPGWWFYINFTAEKVPYTP